MYVIDSRQGFENAAARLLSIKVIIMDSNANAKTIRDPTKHEYVYPFRSLNGTVCYKRVINSMMHWLTTQHEEPDSGEIMKMVVNKAESWTSMRMTYLSQSMNGITDVRVFDMEQIIELNEAQTYDDMWASLMGFRESYRLAYIKQ